MTYRPQIRPADREGFAKCAALSAIEYHIAQVRRARGEAERELNWLVDLHAERDAQMRRGEWP